MNCVSVKYGNQFQKHVDFLVEMQMLDQDFWKLLVLQFCNYTDVETLSWKGEYWGKLMRGASMIEDCASNKKLYGVLEKTVRELLDSADEYGRISTYTVEKEFNGWDIWCRKYVMLGLIYFLEICKDQTLNERIIKVLRAHADYIMNKVGKKGVPFNKTSTAWGGVNSYSILQPFVRLYQLTQEKRYYDYAKEMIEEQDIKGENLFKLAYANELAPHQYPVIKAYEMISCFEGLLDFYSVTKDEKCLETCKRFADKILSTDFTIVGGSGCYDEMFDNSTKKQVTPSNMHMQETCVTVTAMKFFGTLYEVTGEAKYLDAIEKSFYNAYLGAFREKSWTKKREVLFSYSPLISASRWELMGGKQELGGGDYFGCCIAIGAAGLGVIRNAGVSVKDNLITVGLFVDGEYRVQVGGGNLKFNLSGGYPYGNKVKIEIVEGYENKVTLSIRKPNWCKRASVCAENKRVTEKDGFYFIEGEFKKGDFISYELDAPIEIVNSEQFDKDAAPRFAVTKGAIVLCADENYADVDGLYALKTPISYKEKIEDDKIKHVFELDNGKTLTLIPYSQAGGTDTRLTVWLKRKA